jgi:hypothetical protein
MNIEQMAIDAGVIVVEDGKTYWTENDAIEVLEQFTRLVLEEFTTRIEKKLKEDFKSV